MSLSWCEVQGAGFAHRSFLWPPKF